MLNELYDLSLRLEQAGIYPEEWHPDLKELPNISKAKPCFKLLINVEGAVSAIESVQDKQHLEGIRKWQQGSNGYSFPCFNVRPLFTVILDGLTDEEKNERKKYFTKWLKTLKKQIEFSDTDRNNIEEYVRADNRLWNPKHDERIAKCLGEIPDLLRQRLREPPDEFRVITQLIERCEKMVPEQLFQQLIKLLIAQISQNPSESEQYISFLLHAGTKPPTNDISIVLELTDGLSTFPRPAVHPKVHQWINQRLLIENQDAPTSDPLSTEHGTDAFNQTDVDWKMKLSEVKVPILGGVKLRAMNFESPCQTRYGRIDAKSFVIGRDSRKQIKGALEWLTHEERRNKTWGNVSSASDRKEILLVYPSVLPEAPLAAVSMLGGAVVNAAEQTAKFVDYARDVTRALHAMPSPLEEIEIRVVGLRKMDKARTQVSCSQRYTAEYLITAAEEWQKGCRNAPSISIKQWGKEKGQPEWFDFETPFPLEVIWALNTVWPRSGETPARVCTFSSEEGIRLLLHRETHLNPLAKRALHVAVINGSGLLISMGHSQHQGRVHPISKKFEKQARILPTIFGLLLAKLGQLKEDYMKSAPYLIGRLLSVADQLHYHYCQKVRKGQVPTQLMGNALMSTSLETPKKALALYSQRILPYHAWATTVQGKDVGLAKYFLGELGKISSDMDDIKIPDRFFDEDKAQMLLGYLARAQKSDEGGNEPTKGDKHE